MNTCILMPKELSLMLLPTIGRSILDMEVTLWAKQHLHPGREFRADYGEAILDRLEVYSSLHPNDIRRRFGAFDEIILIENQRVRHCNWIRFLRPSYDFKQVNMVARLTGKHPTFQVVRCIRPNDEIKAFFAFESDSLETTEVKSMRPSTVESSPHEHSNVSSNIKSFLSQSSGFFESPMSRRPDAPSSDDSDFKPLDLRYRGDEETSGNESDMNRSTWKEAPITESPLINNLPKKRKIKTWLPCESCGKKFDRPSLLKRHIRTHTGEKPHSCDVCGKAFSTSSSLNTHKRIHSGERPHECLVCGKRFTASSNLYYHRMTHKKEKPHKCTICLKSFPTPGDLKSHQYTHSGSWPFKCEICGKGFSKIANLKNHLLVHGVEEQKWSQKSRKNFKAPQQATQSKIFKSFTIDSLVNTNKTTFH